MAMRKLFQAGPDWKAYEEAEQWLRRKGYSFGPMQSGSPTAIFKGDCDVSKWRNLSNEEKKSADGTITPVGGFRFRDNAVVVTLFHESDI